MFEDSPSLAGPGVIDSSKLKDRRRTDAIAMMDTDEYNEQLKTAITAKTLKFADGNKYKTLPINGRTIKLFEPKHTQEVGSTNVDKDRLQGEESLVVSAIRLQAAMATGTQQDKADDVNTVDLEWYNIGSDMAYLAALLKDGTAVKEVYADDDYPANATVLGVGALSEKRFPGFENGELKLQLAGSKLVVDQLPLNVFTQKENGVYELANPRVINPDKTIDFVLDFGDDNPIFADHDGITSRVFVRAEIIGSTTISRGN